MLFNEDLTGPTITDEKVYCYTPATINGTSGLYMGYIDNIASSEVTLSGYYVKNASNVAQTVILAGIPTSGQVRWNTGDGTIYSPTNGVYHTTYRAYVPIRQHSYIEKTYDQWVSGTLTVTDNLPKYRKFYYYEINTSHVSGACSIQFACNDQSGTISGIVTGNNKGNFASEIKIPANNDFTITVTASDAVDFNIMLTDI